MIQHVIEHGKPEDRARCIDRCVSFPTLLPFGQSVRPTMCQSLFFSSTSSVSVVAGNWSICPNTSSPAMVNSIGFPSDGQSSDGMTAIPRGHGRARNVALFFSPSTVIEKCVLHSTKFQRVQIVEEICQMDGYVPSMQHESCVVLSSLSPSQSTNQSMRLKIVRLLDIFGWVVHRMQSSLFTMMKDPFGTLFPLYSAHLVDAVAWNYSY